MLLEGPNTDSGLTTRPAAFDGMSEFATNRTLLHHEMADCRVIKTEKEMEVLRFFSSSDLCDLIEFLCLRYANKISSLAHMHVMRTIKPGMKEYQVGSIVEILIHYWLSIGV